MSLETTESNASVDASQVDVTSVQEPAQAAESSVTTEEVQPQSTDWRHNPEVYNTIAAVKKEHREKGYNEGYEAAKAALSQQTSQQPQANQQAWNTNQQKDPYIQHLEQRVPEVRYKGASKFKDWDSVVSPLQAVGQLDPNVGQILASALDLPDGVAENVIYELSKDPAKLEALKRVHPAYLPGELVKLSQPQAPATIVKKVAPAPIEDIKAPPANGGGERSYADKVAAAKAKRNKYR